MQSMACLYLWLNKWHKWLIFIIIATVKIYNHVMLFFYGVLRYLGSMAILTTARDHQTLAPCACISHYLHRSLPHYITDNQPFWLHDLCLEVPTVHVISYVCFGQSIPPSHTIDIAAVGTTFFVFSYDAVLAEHRTHHLPKAEQLYYLICHVRTRVFCR